MGVGCVGEGWDVAVSQGVGRGRDCSKSSGKTFHTMNGYFSINLGGAFVLVVESKAT